MSPSIWSLVRWGVDAILLCRRVQSFLVDTTEMGLASTTSRPNKNRHTISPRLAPKNKHLSFPGTPACNAQHITLLLYLQVWRQQHPRRQRGGESDRAPDTGFAGGEMAALGVLAGQAAAALRRLGAEAAEKEGVLQELGAAEADRASETQVKETTKTLLSFCFPGTDRERKGGGRGCLGFDEPGRARRKSGGQCPDTPTCPCTALKYLVGPLRLWELFLGPSVSVPLSL